MNFDTLYYAILYGIIFNVVCALVRLVVITLTKRKKIKSPFIRMGINMINSIFEDNNAKKKETRKKKSKKKKRMHETVTSNPKGETINPLKLIENLLGSMNMSLVNNTSNELRVKEVDTSPDKIDLPSEKEIKEIVDSLE